MSEIVLGTEAASSEPATIASSVLLDHTVVIGADGMGKTSVARVLLEQALAHDCPVVMIDTVGDMTERLRADHELPVLQGLRQDPHPGSEVQLRRVDYDLAEGLFLNPQRRGIEGDAVWELLADEISALLDVLGFAPRRFSPEYSLIETIVSTAWAAERDVTLTELTAAVVSPPFNQIGLFDLDQIISSERRQDLAGAIDGLCRSLPGGGHGGAVPLVIDELLRPDGAGATATVFSFVDGSQKLQQFAVATLLAELGAHASGADVGTSLRLLLIVDEAARLLPHRRRRVTSAMLRRALNSWGEMGVGVVLLADELDDLHEDVEDLVETWIVGGLPAKAARLAVVDNLDLVNPPVDEVALERTLRRFGHGEFVLRSPQIDHLVEFRLSS